MTPSSIQTLCAEIDALTPDTSPDHIRNIASRARRAGRADLLPAFATPKPPETRTNWGNPTAPQPTLHQPDNIASAIDAKSADSGIPPAILRTVMCRGLMSRDPIPPGLTLERSAQARVNSFIRLCQGDPDARTDDADLLALLSNA